MELNLHRQTPRATTDQDVQQAARSLRDQIRENVRAQLEAERARAAGHPVAPAAPPAPEAVVSVPPFGYQSGDDFPPEVVDISIAFFMMVAVIIIGLPLARAFARRMDRRGAAPQIPSEVSAQLTQLTQAVDAIALEVERISEGQRFTTRLLTERETQQHSLPR